jgi:phage-related protein
VGQVVANWELTYYTTARGDSPVRDYIDNLNVDEAVKIDEDLDLLAEFGIRLGAPHVKHLDGTELWELRSRTKSKQHRIFYVAFEGRRFLLLHAFLKKQQKTPQKEIRTAQQRLRDYRGRL